MLNIVKEENRSNYNLEGCLVNVNQKLNVNFGVNLMVSTVVQMRLCAILAPPPFLLYRNGIEFFAMILYANTKELDADYLHFTLFFSAGTPTPSMNTFKILQTVLRTSQKLSVKGPYLCCHEECHFT